MGCFHHARSRQRQSADHELDRQPAVVPHCGFINGLPQAIMFTSNLYDEAAPLRVALAYECVTKVAYEASEPGQPDIRVALAADRKSLLELVLWLLPHKKNIPRPTSNLRALNILH
ncbi:MAG: hypothetical protein ACREA2_05240, partial [Blastocatellia bacterium]